MEKIPENILRVDVNEPYEQALKLMLPSIPAMMDVLNSRGWADYKWETADGQAVQVERKQWQEVLSGLDKIEDQLRRHRQNQPAARTLFLIEGLIDSDSSGTFTIQRTKNGAIWTRGYRSPTPMSRVWPWIYNISEYISTYFTMDYTATCQFLVSAFKQDQKCDKTTFQKYYKPIEWHENPQVTALIGLVPGIGEVRAKALINEFVTVWRVLNASPEDLATVPGIGRKTALTILRGVGRTDV